MKSIKSFVMCFAVLSMASGLDAQIRRSPTPVPGQYIVVLKDTLGAQVSAVASEIAASHSASVRSTWDRAVPGFLITASDEDAKDIAKDPRVRFVEEDGIVEVSSAPEWNLDRIDQRDLPLDGYYAACETGTGVKAYVLDTGIRADHVDLYPRVTSGWDGYSTVDQWGATSGCNGTLNGSHGTFIAGIIGGTNFGVAKNVTFVPVRVINCVGYGLVSTVISGINWVIGDHQPGQLAVANMSFGYMLGQVDLPNHTVTASDMSALDVATQNLILCWFGVNVTARVERYTVARESSVGLPHWC